jgi:glycosyltransferase involved in cell wall biosynthesis
MSGPVLLVTHAGLLGGAERVLLDWAAAIEPPVVLACAPGPLAEAAAAAGHDVSLLAARPLERRGRSGRAALDLAALARDIAGLVRRHRPAVLVASGQRAILAAAAAPAAGAQRIALHHDLPASALVARASSRAHATVATSQAIADALGVPATVIHPGVDLATWTPAPPPDGAPRALFLGALVEWKRPLLALEIAARVPELQLDVAGEPLDPASPLPVALRERAGRPDLRSRVHLLGRIEPRAALAEAHLLLHCADREPFGLALVEALAAGRPVAAPAAGGPVEIVTPACGRLYAPGDPDAGAAAVREVLAARELRAGARERAGDFDGPAAARRFATAVEALMGAR